MRNGAASGSRKWESATISKGINVICITCGTQFTPPGACPECHWNADATLNPDDVCQPGDVLDARYSIRNFLGSGRFGVSFRATDFKQNRDVVLKFIHPAYLPTPPHFKRFMDGIEFLQDSHHPSAVRILNTGRFQGNVFISCEFLRGGTLMGLIRRRHQSHERFTVQEIYPILKEAAAVLIEIPVGFHGAVCPENIFIQSGNIKVTECGLAANLPEAVVLHRLELPAEQQRFVAPEILRGEEIGKRSDVFSLGVILAEMLTLQLYNGDAAEIGSAAAKRAPGIMEIIAKALSSEPRERFQDAEVFLAAVSEIAGFPPPHLKRHWSDGESARNSDHPGAQEDKTAEIVMKDVIQQHFEEITSVGRNPLLSTSGSMASAPVPPKPSGAGSEKNELNMNIPKPSSAKIPKPSKLSEPSNAAGLPKPSISAPPPLPHPTYDSTSQSEPLNDDEQPVPPAPQSDQGEELQLRDDSTARINESVPTAPDDLLSADLSVNKEPTVNIAETQNKKTLRDLLDDTGEIPLANVLDEFDELDDDLLELVDENDDGGSEQTSEKSAGDDVEAQDDDVTVNEKIPMIPDNPPTEAKQVSQPIVPPEAQVSSVSDTNPTERLEGINPRFLRAAKTLKEASEKGPIPASVPQASPFEEDNWRERLEQEMAGRAESMISFLPDANQGSDTPPSVAANAVTAEPSLTADPPPTFPDDTDKNGAEPSSVEAPPETEEPESAADSTAEPVPALPKTPVVPVPPLPATTSSTPSATLASEEHIAEQGEEPPPAALKAAPPVPPPPKVVRPGGVPSTGGPVIQKLAFVPPPPPIKKS
ncbi:MAG: protein kinase [Deltaproteobacteria bacterium]|nr:protein kinase [Deltaproteobacteria bacterium]